MINNKGFTIVEILTALVVGTVVMAAVYAVINLSQKSSAGIERRVAAQQDQKAALELMAMEIAMASYDPTRSVRWVNTSCTDFASEGVAGQFNKGIQVATANAIHIQMDINDDGNILNADNTLDTNESIIYVYADNIYIRRLVNCQAPQSFLGDPDARKRAVRVINNALNVPLFRYFDGQGNELASPVWYTDLPNIRRVLITLAVETENPDPTSGQRKRLIYSTSAIVRNHVPVL